MCVIVATDKKWNWSNLLDGSWINCNTNLQQEIRYLVIWNCWFVYFQFLFYLAISCDIFCLMSSSSNDLIYSFFMNWMDCSCVLCFVFCVLCFVFSTNLIFYWFDCLNWIQFMKLLHNVNLTKMRMFLKLLFQFGE
jgi:hypothetical protein